MLAAPALPALLVAATMRALTACAALLLASAAAAPRAAAAATNPSGAQMTVWPNTAMAGEPSANRTGAPLGGSWPEHDGVLSAQWSGSLTPSAPGAFVFNCSFTGGYGIAWVDGHVLCTHGMPLYRSDVGPGAIPLAGGKAIPIRMHFLKNESAPGDAAAEMRWAPADAELMKPIPASAAVAAREWQPIPTDALSAQLPSAAQARMAALQREQYAHTAGWGSWYPHNLLAVTRLPDGAQLRFGLCQLSTGDCELNTIDSAQSVRLGAHASDGSFAQLYHWFAGSKWDGGVNVSVAWGTQPPAAGGSNALADLRLTIGEATCGNCSNYAIVLQPGFSPIWGRTGNASVDQGGSTLTIAPAGSLPATTLSATGPRLPAGAAPAAESADALGKDVLRFAVEAGKKDSVVVSSVADESPAATSGALRKAEAAERATYESYGTPELAEIKEAVQASVNW